MCGIVGLVSTDPIVRPNLLLAMRDTMVHRGPDDEGIWCSADGGVGLAHRRLAIIDLSPGGRQPMADASNQCHVVFNGEIYNYRELRDELEGKGQRFRTASDTEVLLAAYRVWGTDCLTRLNGMFAFGLYDEGQRRLFLARDRAGEKPLFYAHRSGHLVFASELKALFADPTCPRELDLQALEHYLAFGYVPDGLCMVKGIRKLQQGHALLYDPHAERVRTWRYWSLPEPEPDAVTPPGGELVEELEALLTDSVRMRLIADVPVGIMLSGGIDSSLVTALAARASARQVKTFNISFPGQGRYDEAPYARQVARHFDTEHVEMAAEAASVDLLPILARQFDEPIADSSLVPTYLISQLIRREATVALGGDGGDELFGGYPHYSWLQTQARIRRYLPRPFQQLVKALGPTVLPLGVKGRNYFLGLATDLPGSLAQFNLYFDADARRRLLEPVRTGDRRHDDPESFKKSLCRDGRTVVQQATAVDFHTYLVDDILVKVDRASMLASLEVRAPWLDPRLIDFAFRLVPDALRATSRERKLLPRALAARLLPASLDLRRKQGFTLPLARWFKGNWGAYFIDVLREAEPTIFDRRFIDGLLFRQHRGFANTHRLFALTFFELWRRTYGVTVGGRS